MTRFLDSIYMINKDKAPIDFTINNNQKTICKAFKALGIDSFKEASTWVSNLPYGRNSNKTNVFSLFEDQCGTCSTKHAVLKRLADENQQAGFKLMLGIFPMNADNTPGVQSVLKKYALAYIPEAHNYLMYHDSMLDFTGLGINTSKFRLDLLDETEISPDQITDFKVSYHKDFLTNWIAQYNIPYSIDQLWRIREECIEALGER